MDFGWINGSIAPRDITFIGLVDGKSAKHVETTSFNPPKSFQVPADFRCDDEHTQRQLAFQGVPAVQGPEFRN